MDRECRSKGGTRSRNDADRPADPLRISQRIGYSRGLARRSMPNDSSMQLELPSWFNPRSADISRLAAVTASVVSIDQKALGLKLWTPVSAVMPCSSDPLRLRHIILRFG